MRIALALGIVAAVAAAPRPADACSFGLGPPGAPNYPWWSEQGFPTNGLFTSTLEWTRADGGALTLVEDAALTARLRFPVRRPTTLLAVGSRIACA